MTMKLGLERTQTLPNNISKGRRELKKRNPKSLNKTFKGNGKDC